MPNTMNAADALDAIIHDAAMRAADEGVSTLAERDADERVAAMLHTQIAALRRSRLPVAEPPRKAGPVRPSLLALTREMLLARLAAVTTALGGSVQYAHRNLDELTDDDLRRLVDMIEPRVTE